MKPENQNKIIENVTMVGDRYLVLSFIETLEFGGLYYGESIEGNKVRYLKIFYDFPVATEEEWAKLEDEFYAFVEKKPNNVQKPIEFFKSQIKGIDGYVPVLVLGKSKGENIREIMNKDIYRSLEIDEALRVANETAIAMQNLIQTGWLHKDLRPENLFKKANGEILLLNPPVIRTLEPRNEDCNLQKKFYTAPEVFAGAEQNQSTEIYAFGCLLHELLESSTPFLGEDQKSQHLESECPGLNEVSAKVNKLILTCLSKKPAKRFKNFSEIDKILVRTYKNNRKKQGRPLKSGFFLLAFLFLTASGGYFLWDKQFKPKQKVISRTVVAEPVTKNTKKKKGEKEKPVTIEDLLPKAIGEEINGMVFYPYGSFQMGSPRGEEDGKIVHEVTLYPFYLDKTEITNEEFEEYLIASKTQIPLNPKGKYNLWKDNKPPQAILKQPVINIDWDSARNYCEWKGKRLPTEAEWEFAARGREGREYPWGNDEPTPQLAQYDNDWNGDQTLYEVNFFSPGVSPEGVFNLFGGVREWVSDWYGEDYYSKSDKINPKGPENGEKKSLRGGSWSEVDQPSYIRDALPPDQKMEDVGFRCAMSMNLDTVLAQVEEHNKSIDQTRKDSTK